MSSGCGDVLSLEDLKTAKLHQIFEAEVITGKQGGVATGSDIDYATNQVTGQVQKTMPAILRDVGFQPASFDFTTGGTLTVNDRNKAVLWSVSSGGDGFWYYWEGALPKVIPASSSPATTGGVADGSWKVLGDITLREQLSSSGENLGDALIAVKQQYVGSALRTQHNKNSDTISVKDFGIKGDGTDESALWASMISNLPAGSTTLHVPSGNYVCNTAISLVYAKLPTLIVDSEATLSPAISFSAFLNVQYRKRDETKFGPGLASSGSTQGVGGFKVGGGALMDSGDGMALSSDGHANWMRVQTTKNYNPSEIVLYGSAAQGQLIHQSQNVLVRQSGSEFDLTNWAVGDAIYAFNQALVITALTSINQISVTAIGGGNLSASVGSTSKFHYVYTTASGLCDVVAGICTRKSGDPFFFFGYGSGAFKFWLNGSLRTVLSVSNQGNTCTLEDTSLNLTNASYKERDDIAAQISTIRVQKTQGSDEENLVISAKATGEYEIRAGISGTGQYYPIRFYNGSDGAYLPHKVMEITPTGLVGIMNTGGTPVALLSVDNKTNSPFSDATLKTAVVVRSTYNEGGREIWMGGHSNNGSNGGFIQGSDRSGNNYQLTINPRGGNVGINTTDPVFPLDVNGACGPHIDNAYTLGNSSRRWTQVWATNGTIQTSDERLKNFEELSAPEIQCGLQLSRLIKKFRWKDGSDALNHFGVMAQKVVSIFEENGLDALEYGVVLYDAEADIYSVSYSELNSLCIAALAEKLLS